METDLIRVSLSKEPVGTVVEGHYVDGEKHGQWIARRVDGHVEEERYENGDLMSYWRGRYVDGERHGEWLVKHGKWL